MNIIDLQTTGFPKRNVVKTASMVKSETLKNGFESLISSFVISYLCNEESDMIS